MAYHMLFTKENGKWQPQFGDHERSVVHQEWKDSYKGAEKHIAKLPSAHQKHVNEYQKKLNSTVTEAKITKNLVATWPAASGEANFVATNFHKDSPSNKFLLPDNGVFKIATKVFNRGANKFGYDMDQSIEKMDHKVPDEERGIGENLNEEEPDLKQVLGHVKSFANSNRNSFIRKKLRFYSLLNRKNPTVLTPIKQEENIVNEISSKKLGDYISRAATSAADEAATTTQKKLKKKNFLDDPNSFDISPQEAKRHRGIYTATQKLVKRASQNESISEECKYSFDDLKARIADGNKRYNGGKVGGESKPKKLDASSTEVTQVEENKKVEKVKAALKKKDNE